MVKVMLFVLIDGIDWLEVVLNSPICFSGFGVGLCLNACVADWEACL